MKLKNRFYVASDRIVEGGVNPQWRKPTLEAAVRHAQELMDSDDTDEKYIVQIVRVIRRKKAPIEVIKVEG